MSEPDEDADQAMADWDEGADMDEEFRQGNCIEVDFSDEDAPIDSDDGEGSDEEDKEIGVIDEHEIYADMEDPYSDEALASVEHNESVLSVAICPTDRHIMATGGQDDVAVLWGIEEQQGKLTCVQHYRLEGHTDSITQVAFSHDGKYVATGSYDGTARIWDTKGGTLVHALEGPSKEIEWVLWHPKGYAILAGSNDNMAWMWWAPSGQLMQVFAGHAQGVTCGCWGLGGKLICTGSEDCSVIVWNPRTATPTQHVKQVHESGIISICSHPDAPIVVTGSQDSVARVIQIETGKILANLCGHVDSVEAVGFNTPAVGGMLLVATASMDGKVMIWDGKTFDLRWTFKEHFERGGVVKCKWLPAPYGSWLCTCATDSTLRLLNASSGECIRTFRGHTDTVLDLDFALGDSRDAHGGMQVYISSSSDDKTCRIFAETLPKAGGIHSSGKNPVGATKVTPDPTVEHAPKTCELENPPVVLGKPMADESAASLPV